MNGTFDKDKAELALRALSPITLERLPLSQSFPLLISFYEGHPAEGAVPDDEDGDMLLFQWGIYDWQHGPRFEINLTRQVIYPDEDDQEIWQLSLTYGFEPSGGFAQLSSGEAWCDSRDAVRSFREEIVASPAFVACEGQAPLSVELRWDRT